MEEWIHEGLPYYSEEAQVWLDDGQVRRVRRDVGSGGFRFLDCTHPLSNVYCDSSKILAWRPAPKRTDAQFVAEVRRMVAIGAL